MNVQDIVRTPMRVGESDRNIQISGGKTGITKLSVSIRSQRWILEGVCRQYERTSMSQSLVCRL